MALLAIAACSLTAVGGEDSAGKSSSAISAAAASPVRQAPQQLSPGERGVGRFVADWEFSDLSGTKRHLRDLIGGKHKATVVAMTSTSCPLSKKYLPTLQNLAREFAPQGVAFLLVNPVATDKPADMRAAQATLGDAAIYVADTQGAFANAVGATSTTDVVVLDAAATVSYHGAIDDQFGLGYALDAPRQSYLANAINAILKDQLPAISATAAPGCLLKLKPNQNSGTVQTTYHGQISRMVQRHCIECHREGGVAPFALDSLDDVKAHAPMIADVVRRGAMPPWFAAKPPGNAASPWHNDRSLSDAEKHELLAWIEADMPAGDPKQSPLPREFPDGWLIGKPDAVYEFSSPVQVQATGFMPYIDVVVETDQTEDRWVQAIEIRPSERGVVHHVIVSVLPPAEGGDSDQRALDEAQQGYWGAYVPGTSSIVLPDGLAKRLPAKARLNFQMHYTPNGTAAEDRTRIGMKFTSTPPQHELRVHGTFKSDFKIPPHADNYQVESSVQLPHDAFVYAFLPHAHLRGKACRYELIRVDGSVETLLDIPHYDFNWQLRYQYAEPLLIKKGDTIKYTAWYDNSANNPANPDPSKTVGWGPQTIDEMHIGYVEYVLPHVAPGE